MGTTTTRIVVGVNDDDPASCHAALALVAARARRAPVTVRLVHGLDTEMYPGLHAAERRTVAYRLLRHAERYLSLSLSGPVRCEAVLSARSGIEALVTESEHADLVVVQRRDLSGPKRLASISATSAVAAQASCPVVVVRAVHRTTESWGRVLVGVDARSHATAAVAAAFDEASGRAAELVALHAWGDDSEPQPYHGSLPSGLAELESYRRQAADLLRRAVAAEAAAHPEVDVHPYAVPGAAAANLVRESRRADLVVVARHGTPHLASLGLGRVARTLLTESECPVLVTATHRDTDKTPEENIPGRAALVSKATAEPS